MNKIIDPDLQRQVTRIQDTLATLIGWISESAGSPITFKEAQALLNILRGEE